MGEGIFGSSLVLPVPRVTENFRVRGIGASAQLDLGRSTCALALLILAVAQALLQNSKRQ